MGWVKFIEDQQHSQIVFCSVRIFGPNVILTFVDDKNPGVTSSLTFKTEETKKEKTGPE